jgi:hypothetical protein
MGGARGLFDLVGAFLQLLGLDGQQVAARVDSDVLQFRRLFAKLLGLFHAIVESAGISFIRLGQGGAGGAVGQAEEAAFLGAQEQRAAGHIIKKGAIVAGGDDTDLTGQSRKPFGQLANAPKVKVVGRLVEQEQVRISNCGAGEQRRALPTAGQDRLSRWSRNAFRHLQAIERHLHTPAFRFRHLPVERRGHRLPQRQAQETGRHVLGHMAHGQAPRTGDVARSRVQRSGKAMQKR